MKCITFSIFTFLLFSVSLTNAQNYQLVDGFEDGLQNWDYSYTEYPDYFGYEYHNGVDILGLSDENIAFGEQVLRLDPINSINGAVRCIKTDFLGMYGTYTSWIYMEPNDDMHMSTDGMFYFQYINSNKYYLVTIYPADSDNPGIKLRKMIDGELETIGEYEALTSFNNWYKLIIEKRRTGEIVVSIHNPYNNVTTEAINVYDMSILQSGNLGVGCFSNSVIWDEIGFDNSSDYYDMFNNNDSALYAIENLPLEIDLFPNPCVDELFINVKTDDVIEELNIFSIDGRLVKELDPRVLYAEVSELKTGMYLLMARSNSKTSSIRFNVIR